MMIKFAAIKAPKNETTGESMKPNAANYAEKDLFVIASDDNPYSIKVTGYPGQTYAAGALYVGNFNTDENKFVSDLVPAPEVKVPGSMNPKNVEAHDDGSISEDK